MENTLGFFDRLNRWIKESITVKLASIGILILLLLIPQAWIQGIIEDREQRADSVIEEIASKWSGRQTVSGPILVIPFMRHEKIDKGKDGIEIREWKEIASFLPEHLKVKGIVKPQLLHRGIFDAAVYESQLFMTASFPAPDFEKLNIAQEDVLWKEAHLDLGIPDLRGISDNPVLKMGDQDLIGEPSSTLGVIDGHGIATTDSNNTPQPVRTGIMMKLPWTKPEDFHGEALFQLNLKGSTLLYFSPIGKTTEVSLEGPWADPSFDGDFLPNPDTKEITAAGFKADWKILHFNRPFSQQWIGDSQNPSSNEFGVRLIIPADQYQKSIRTAKYGILMILLTFMALFLVEIMKKVRIHPFQYILIGAALIIYYSLLLSLSEHFGYDIAYVISTIATIALIALYSSSFMASKKLVYIFTGLLIFFYTFIFVIIQMQDFSLLIGSIGLFLTVGLVMYFSRGIEWYKDN